MQMQISCIVIGASASAIDIFVTVLFINAVLTMLWMQNLSISISVFCSFVQFWALAQWIVCRIANEAQETPVIVRRVEWP